MAEEPKKTTETPTKSPSDFITDSLITNVSSGENPGDIVQSPDYAPLREHLKTLSPKDGTKFLRDFQREVRERTDALKNKAPEKKDATTETKAKTDAPVEDPLMKSLNLSPGKKTEEKPAEKKEEILDLEKLTAPDEKNKFRADWDKLKSFAKQSREQLAAAEAKLAELGKSSASSEDLVKANDALKVLQEKFDAANKKLYAFDTKNSPEFISKFSEPMANAEAAMKGLLKELDVEFDLSKALVSDGKTARQMFGELYGHLDEFSRMQFNSYLSEYQKLAKDSSVELANSEQWVKKEHERASLDMRAAFDSAVKKYPVVYKPLAVDPANPVPEAVAYNEGVAGIQKEAEALAFSRGSLEDAGHTALDAAQYRFLVKHGLPALVTSYSKQLSTKDAKIAELTAALSKVTKSNPVPEGSGKEQIAFDAEHPNFKGMSYEESLRRMGQVFRK